jgi:hypothetical protein
VMSLAVMDAPYGQLQRELNILFPVFINEFNNCLSPEPRQRDMVSIFERE